MIFLRITPCLLIIVLMNSFVIGQDSTDVNGLNSSIKVSALVNTKEVPLNRTITLTIKVSWVGGLDQYEIYEFDNPVVRNLEIIGTSSANRVTGGHKPEAVKEYEFTLSPVSLGMAYIEPAIITYNDRVLEQNQRLVTNRLDVKVIDPVPEPGEAASIWIFLVIGMFVIGAGAVVYLLAQKKRNERKALEESEPVLPLEEQYLQQLKEIVDLNAVELDVGKSFSKVSRLYRKYLAEKYNIQALETTTEEVNNALSESNVDERFFNSTQEILSACDLAKFSGGAGSKSELERVYTLIESNLERSLRGEVTVSSKDEVQEREEK